MWSLRSTTWSFAPAKNGSPEMFFSAAPRPGWQETRHDRLARGLLLGVTHADRGRDDGAEVLDVLHHSFVARRLEVVGRVEAVAAADQHQDGVGVRERRVSRQLEDGQTAVGRLLLHRGPGGRVDAHVLEVDAGKVQGEAALLAATHGSVEVGQLGLVHGSKSVPHRESHPGRPPWSMRARTWWPSRLPATPGQRRRWSASNHHGPQSISRLGQVFREVTRPLSAAAGTAAPAPAR